MYQQPPYPPPNQFPAQPASGPSPHSQAPPLIFPGCQQAPLHPTSGHHGAQAPYSYHPQVGFTRLPARFHICNAMTSGGTSCLELKPQLNGPVAYSAKMFSSSRLKIKEGPYESAPLPICTIESRHTFSSKSTVSFDGFQMNFKETSRFDEGATWPFEVEVNGRPQTWQWRKKTLAGSSSQRKIGRWELVPVSGEDWSAATFEPSGGTTFDKDVELGVFQFHGPASTGQLGDIFANVGVAILLRILSQHYISRIATLAGSAV
ncbi:hypothetical protein F66182_4529 [Fusarium sp. NRRL 66182]|nr:hypothetical protein F66182_4529 [Fusarium sp. NRRL 66182]